MAKRRWSSLTKQTRGRYLSQGISSEMYEYGMPLTSRTTLSEETIRERMVKRAKKIDMTEYEVDMVIFIMGASEAWRLHRAIEAARRARNDGNQAVASQIYNVVYRPDLPSWVFWYQFR